MSSTQELTYSDVSEHKSKKARTLTRLAPFPRRIKSADNFSSPVTQDLYLVIHDKIYNATTFVDEHPGGEEVLLDVGGQDATEAFEDVGHSDEAREILDGLLIGKLQRAENDPAPKLSTGGTSTASASAQGNAAGLGIGLYALILLGGALAFGAYKYLQANSQKTTL